MYKGGGIKDREVFEIRRNEQKKKLENIGDRNFVTT